MNKKYRALLVVIILIIAQMACNLPNPNGQESTLPAPNQTLTALFSVTLPAASETPTLPLIVTATPGAATPGGAVATATQAAPQPTQSGAASNPTATNKPPAPTNTTAPLPQPSATIPFARPRAAVKAKYLNTPPTIDGDWSEWKDITTEYPANNVVWGKENWTGEDDLASSFHIGWDNNYLYVAMKVRDDKYVQNASGANIYEGDSLELLLDTNLREDYYYTKLSPDDFQLGISPGRPDPNGTKEAYLWFPSNIAGSRNNVKIGSRLESGVYRVEAAIPWNVFELTPVNGAHYGFCLSVNDNDNPSENVQQSMVSNVATRRLTDPTTWGDLQLVK